MENVEFPFSFCKVFTYDWFCCVCVYIYIWERERGREITLKVHEK